MVSDAGGSLETPQIQKLNKYIRGEKIKYTCSRMGTVNFRNKISVISFSYHHQDTVYLDQNLPCYRIDLSHIHDFDALFEFMNSDVGSSNLWEWLRTCLPLYGLYLLGEQTYYNIPFPKNKKPSATDGTTPSVIKDFLDSCCQFSADSFVYADTLYHAYINYCQKYSRGTPLKRTQLVKELRAMSSLTYKRPHVSRSVSNRYAFVGLKLVSDCSEDEILSSSESNVKNEENYPWKEEGWIKKIKEITDLVPPIK